MDQGALLKTIQDAAKSLVKAMPDTTDSYNDMELINTLDSNNGHLVDELHTTNSHLEDCSKALARCADALEETVKLKKQKLYK